jgi:hypothetical protein
MTSWVVVDSGIYLAGVLRETISSKALVFLTFIDVQQWAVAAPMLFRYEVTAVLRKQVYQNESVLTRHHFTLANCSNNQSTIF